MLFFNRTTRCVLAPLADRLEQPDQPGTPLSSSHPLLRRILASVEQLLQERRTLKEQVPRADVGNPPVGGAPGPP